jgi:hypothetical protein
MKKLFLETTDDFLVKEEILWNRNENHFLAPTSAGNLSSVVGCH